MKKKGFTLIELLAVIVILAIIAVITIPTILGVIEKVRKAAYKDSVYGIIDAARIYLSSNVGNYDENNEIEFVCNGKTCSNKKDELSFKGSVPKSGSIYIKGDGTILVESLYNGRYYANNETGEVVITGTDSTMTRGELTNQVNSLISKYNELETKYNNLLSQNSTQDSKINSLQATATSIDEVYPVGSIYISTSEVNPSNLYPGTEWESYGEGRTLVGNNGSTYKAGTTGGSSTVKLSASQIPSLSVSGKTDSTGNGYKVTYGSSNRTVSSWSGSHAHEIHLPVNPNTGSINSNGYFTGGGGNQYWQTTFAQIALNTQITVSGQTVADYYVNSISGIQDHTHPFTGKYTNNSQTDVSVQNPYIVVYMWKRTK